MLNTANSKKIALKCGNERFSQYGSTQIFRTSVRPVSLCHAPSATERHDRLMDLPSSLRMQVHQRKPSMYGTAMWSAWQRLSMLPRRPVTKTSITNDENMFWSGNERYRSPRARDAGGRVSGYDRGLLRGSDLARDRRLRGEIAAGRLN